MSSLINRFGAANPQFLRECRGRLRLRSVMAAIGLSLLFQLLLLLSAINPSYLELEERINWEQVASTLSWTIPYALFALGGYYIVDDLTQEAKTGTLNFIRLSPRPAREILLGKLLGVPVLPVLLVLALVPLHVFAALVIGRSPLLLLSDYLVVGIGTVTVYILALLVGLGSGSSKLAQQRAVSAIAFAGLTLFGLSPLFMLWNTQVTWYTVPTGADFFRGWGDSLEWLYLDIATNPWFAHLFILGNLAGVSAIAWRMAIRKFRVPHSTLLSKQMSYVGVAYANFVFWGFSLSSVLDAYDKAGLMAVLYFLNVTLFFVLMFAITPSRQMLLDWVRYRSSAQNFAKRASSETSGVVPSDTGRGNAGRVSGGVGSWRAWLWADGSPSVVAIAVTFVIAAALIFPSFLWFMHESGVGISGGYDDDVSFAAVLFAALSIGLSALTYATLVQVIYSRRLRVPTVWAAGCVAVLVFVPPLILLFLEMYPEDFGTLWTFLGIPLMGNAATQVTTLSLVGLVGQLCFLGFLLTRLDVNLKALAGQRLAD